MVKKLSIFMASIGVVGAIFFWINCSSYQPQYYSISFGDQTVTLGIKYTPKPPPTGVRNHVAFGISELNPGLFKSDEVIAFISQDYKDFCEGYYVCDSILIGFEKYLTVVNSNEEFKFAIEDSLFVVHFDSTRVQLFENSGVLCTVTSKPVEPGRYIYNASFYIRDHLNKELPIDFLD